MLIYFIYYYKSGGSLFLFIHLYYIFVHCKPPEVLSQPVLSQPVSNKEYYLLNYLLYLNGICFDSKGP